MNTLAKKQHGASIWMLLLVVGILGFGMVFALKLAPIYMESMKIEKAMKTVMKSGGVEDMTKRAIITSLVKRIDIDGITRITERNFKEFGTIKKQGSKVTMQLDYEAEDKLAANVYLKVVFSMTASN